MSTSTDQLIALLTQQLTQQKKQMELQKEQVDMQREENWKLIKLLTQSAGKKAATATPSFTSFNPSAEL